MNYNRADRSNTQHTATRWTVLPKAPERRHFRIHAEIYRLCIKISGSLKQYLTQSALDQNTNLDLCTYSIAGLNLYIAYL